MPYRLLPYARAAWAAVTLAALGASGSANEAASPATAAPIDPAARMADLPPAVIDDALAIGGEDIKGRKVRTRMTVEVQVNKAGPSTLR